MIDPIRREKIERMCASLEGTCDCATYKQKTLGLFPLTEDEQALMDDIVFQCPECGWWCRTDDMVDGRCEDCYEEELREEEEEDDE